MLLSGKSENGNALVLEPVISMPKVTSHKAVEKQTKSQKPTHKDEKIAFVLFLVGGFTIWNTF